MKAQYHLHNQQEAHKVFLSDPVWFSQVPNIPFDKVNRNLKLGVHHGLLDSLLQLFAFPTTFQKKKSAFKDCKYLSAPSQANKQTYNERN